MEMQPAGAGSANPGREGRRRNAKLWPMWMRVVHTIIPCCLAFLITFATSTSIPAIPVISAYFHVSNTASILTLSLYTLGVAFGPLIIAPLSEAFGRKVVYIATTSALLAFTAGAAASRSFTGLLACRFFGGFLGSAGVAMGAGTVADIWHLSTSGGRAAVPFIMGPFLGPTLGPLAGAYILKSHGNDWRWTQWIILIVGAPIWAGTIIMQETSNPVPPVDDARSQGVATMLGAASASIARKVIQSSYKAISILLQDPIVFSLTIYTAFAYAVIFSFFASADYVLSRDYHFNEQQVGLSFLAISIGYFLAALLFFLFDVTLFTKAGSRAQREGKDSAEPEHRLYSALAGSVFIPLGLFWYAWEAHMDGNWAALVASGIPFGLGAFSLFLSTITYLVDIYKARAAASAIAANGTLRYTLGAVFPLFTIQMYENLGVHWAGSIFAFLSLVLLPIPWLLFRYGRLLRQRSRYAVSQ